MVEWNNVVIFWGCFAITHNCSLFIKFQFTQFNSETLTKYLSFLSLNFFFLRNENYTLIFNRILVNLHRKQTAYFWRLFNHFFSSLDRIANIFYGIKNWNDQDFFESINLSIFGLNKENADFWSIEFELVIGLRLLDLKTLSFIFKMKKNLIFDYSVKILMNLLVFTYLKGITLWMLHSD